MNQKVKAISKLVKNFDQEEDKEFDRWWKQHLSDKYRRKRR